MKLPRLGNRGMAGMQEASMVIGLLMIAIVMGLIITNLDAIVTLTGQGNTTYNLIKNICWVVLTLDAIGVLVLVAKWIMSILA